MSKYTKKICVPQYIPKMTDKYKDVKYGIKFGDKNIGYNNKFYTFPYFTMFLIKRFIRTLDNKKITLKDIVIYHIFYTMASAKWQNLSKIFIDTIYSITQ